MLRLLASALARVSGRERSGVEAALRGLASPVRAPGLRLGRNVQFVGLSSEDPSKVAAFARSLGVTYPLWVGGDEVEELSRRLGNVTGALPHTLVLDRSGRVVAAKVGAYTEGTLTAVLDNASAETSPK